MRFKFLFVITCLIFLIGCTPATPISNTPSITPSRTPEPTFTVTPFQFFTLTPRPIKSPTPTFDASQLSTYTPALPAECPKQTTNVIPVFKSDPNKFCSDTETQVLEFLNSGGKIESVVTAMKGKASQMDLTNDGVPELTVAECSFRIYSCNDGQYIKVLDMGDKEGFSHIIDVKDMNLNGIPELIIGGGVFPFSNASTMYYRILEWDNNQAFRNLSEQPDFSSRLDGSGAYNNWIYTEGVGRGVDGIGSNLELVDMDGNGTIEFVLNSGLPTSFDGQANGPWRAETSVFMWNGQNFLPYSIEAEPPQFRFQAVQDADFETLNREYEKALVLYQQVISDKSLDSWSEQRQEHEVEMLHALFNGSATPTPIAPDEKEYQNLVAYAYYRIMLLHILRGDFSEAQKTYKILQDKFSSNQDSHSVAEIAKEFWQEFLDTQKMSSACSKVIGFVNSHPKDLLNYIGDVDSYYHIGKNGIYHGWQSKRYSPSDICPFR